MDATDPLELQMQTRQMPIPTPERSGRVRWYSAAQGYGFIEPDDGDEDVFVRHSAIEGEGFRSLNPDQRVRYRETSDGRGPRAVSVRPV